MLTLSLLLAPLMATAQGPGQVGPSTLGADEPPVRLWLSGDRRFEPGDRARVQVEARDDGYLLVLNYDTDGRVRVLFPVDPRDDALVQGGRRYEVRGRSARESFVAGGDGSGFVYVALSPDPWAFREISRGGNWDYDRVAIDPDTQDPERDLTSLLERLASNRGFDYDLVEYFVNDVEIVRYDYRPRRYYGTLGWAGDPGCDPFWSSGWYCGARTGVVVSFGRVYAGDWWSVGYGPSWYWPASPGYYYRPYSYGRGYTFVHHRPWINLTPTYRPRAGQAVLAGRPRDYTVGRSSPWTFGDYNRDGSGRPAARGADRDRPREGAGGRARPATTRESPPAARGGRPASDGDRRAAPAGGRPSTERASPPSRGGSEGAPPRARPRARGGDDAAEVRSARPAASGQVASSRPANRRAEGARPAVRPQPRQEAPVVNRSGEKREAPPAARAQPRRESPPRAAASSAPRKAPQADRARATSGRRPRG